MSIAACLSTGKDNWETPDALFQRYNDTYHFILDAAANVANHKVDPWFGPGGIEQDALVCDWMPYIQRGNIWLNPPYSRGLQSKFVCTALAAASLGTNGNRIVCLLPARTDTKLFHEIIQPHASVEFIRGRIKFINPDGPLLRGTKMNGSNNAAPFPSMIVVF